MRPRCVPSLLLSPKLHRSTLSGLRKIELIPSVIPNHLSDFLPSNPCRRPKRKWSPASLRTSSLTSRLTSACQPLTVMVSFIPMPQLQSSSLIVFLADFQGGNVMEAEGDTLRASVLSEAAAFCFAAVKNEVDDSEGECDCEIHCERSFQIFCFYRPGN